MGIGTFWPITPIYDRDTLPCASNWVATYLAVLIGTAKQRPWAVGMTAVLMPTDQAAGIDQRAAGIAGI